MTIPNYKQRLDLFRKSKRINQKNYKWRYTVIPSDWLAQMGFYFDPIEQENSDLILKDAINCIYCHRHTFDLKHCRSKSKDKLETISNVLLQHLSGDNLNCPISYLRLKIIKDFKYSLGTSNWSNDPIFNDPFNLITRNIFRTSFLDLNSNQSWNKDKINDVINAGLIHFDLSFNAFNNNDYIVDLPTTSSSPSSSVSSSSSSSYDIVFCIYCKNIIRLNFNDTLKPIERHFLACHNGHCYFFKKLIQMFPDFKDLGNIHEFNIVDETEPTNSMDSIIHNSLLYENLTKDNISRSKNEDVYDIQNKTTFTPEQMNKVEELKNLDQSANNIKEHSQNIDRNNMDSNSKQGDNITSEELSTGDGYELSDKSQSIEENDPTYEDDMDTGDEEEEKIYHKIEQQPTLITSPKEDRNDNDNNLNDKTQILQDQTKETTNLSKTNIKKRKKLLGKLPQRIVSNTDTTFNDDVSSEKSVHLSKNKDLILNFTDHVNRKKEITRTNKILDDSADDFSFSNNGSHLFQLSPLKKLESPIYKEKLIVNKQYLQFPETAETRSEITNNSTNLRSPIGPNEMDDNKNSSASSEVPGIEKNIHSSAPSSIIHDLKQQKILLIDDEKEQYTESTNQEEKDQMISEKIHNDNTTMLLQTNSNDGNNKFESENILTKENKKFVIQQENNLDTHHGSPKLNNENKSTNAFKISEAQLSVEKVLTVTETVNETSFKRLREELVDQQLSSTKKKKKSSVSRIEDEKENKPKHDNNNPVGRILSGASLATKIPNTMINKNNMKENLVEIQKNNDFLTSSSSITEELDHYIPSPEKNIISSSLLPQEKELSFRRLRHA